MIRAQHCLGETLLRTEVSCTYHSPPSSPRLFIEDKTDKLLLSGAMNLSLGLVSGSFTSFPSGEISCFSASVLYRVRLMKHYVFALVDRAVRVSRRGTAINHQIIREFFFIFFLARLNDK